jgi:hypothetical protein
LVNHQLRGLRSLGAAAGARRPPALAPLWLLAHRVLGRF